MLCYVMYLNPYLNKTCFQGERKQTKNQSGGPWENGPALGASLELYGAKRVYDQNSTQTCLGKNGRLIVSHTENPRQKTGFGLGWVQGLNQTFTRWVSPTPCLALPDTHATQGRAGLVAVTEPHGTGSWLPEGEALMAPEKRK